MSTDLLGWLNHTNKRPRGDKPRGPERFREALLKKHHPVEKLLNLSKFLDGGKPRSDGVELRSFPEHLLKERQPLRASGGPPLNVVELTCVQEGVLCSPVERHNAGIAIVALLPLYDVGE